MALVAAVPRGLQAARPTAARPRRAALEPPDRRPPEPGAARLASDDETLVLAHLPVHLGYGEYLADAGSVELTKDPDAMISALRKIEGRGELPGATSAVMELCVDNPREGFADLFATHPSVQSRVDKLVKFAGGRDPGPLAPPEDAGEEPEQQEAAPADRSPPLPPKGPWSDTAEPAPVPGQGPWGPHS